MLALRRASDRSTVQGNANMAVQIIADRSADSIPHKIQIFSGGCKLCKETIGIVEIGRCRSCKMEVFDVASEGNAKLVKRYDINAVPSIVIDGKIKVVGIPTFPWFCGDEFYRMLERKYPLSAS